MMEGVKFFFKRFITKPSGLIGVSVVAILIFSALMAEVLSPYSPTKMGAGKRFLKPSSNYVLGTDEFGRDMLSRILHGSRLTLMIGATAVGISLSTGMFIGLIAAYRKGILEQILMRGTDVLFSFTETLIALSCVAVLGPSLENAVIAPHLGGATRKTRNGMVQRTIDNLLAGLTGRSMPSRVA